jgi:hypothetical protein
MNWHLVRDGKHYGPFDQQALQNLIAQGQIQPGDMVRPDNSPNWIPASQALRAAPPPTGKKRGCLGCLTLLIGIPALLLLTLFLWLKYKDSSNITLGPATPLTTQTIPPSGGVIAIPNGPILTVSSDAYTQPTTFNITSTEITAHNLGPLFHPASPLISIDNGHGYANDPIILKIPITLAKDEFALGFFYDRKTGRLEGIPLVAEDARSITILTRHFSDIVISKAKKAEVINALPVDSGYLPGADDWQFTNFGSWLAPAGHCAGQSITSLWYFLEKKKAAGERALYGRYDNNDYGMGTIDLQHDDSWGYRFASVVQSELDWNSLSRRIVRKFNGFNSGLTWLAFAYAIHLTGEPQYIEIWGQSTDKAGKTTEAGHAMVVYKADATGLYIADPNYHGNGNRKITLAAGQLQPYNSGLNKAEIDKGNGMSFPVLLYIGKTAIADWPNVATRYAEIATAKIGNDKFPKWKVSYLVKDGPNPKWLELPKVIKMAEPNIRLHIKFPYGSGAAPYRVTVYKGTAPQNTGSFDANGDAYYTASLEKGVNNLGFYYFQLDANGDEQYIDFKRVRILSGDEDLTGTWKGEMTVRGTEVFRKYIETGIVAVLRAFLPDRSESDLRAAAAASITMNVETHPFTLQLAKRPNDEAKYDFTMTGPETVTGVADYKDGELSWRARAADRSTADYRGTLAAKGTLNGTINISAWGLIPNAATSTFHAKKN